MFAMSSLKHVSHGFVIDSDFQKKSLCTLQTVSLNPTYILDLNFKTLDVFHL